MGFAAGNSVGIACFDEQGFAVYPERERPFEKIADLFVGMAVFGDDRTRVDSELLDVCFGATGQQLQMSTVDSLGTRSLGLRDDFHVCCLRAIR
ncbi:MAG: hypothetical protein ACI9K3_000586 [Halovenus sp.]